MQFIDLKTQQARIKDQIDSRIQDVLRHGQYIMGPEIKELEDKLAAYVGVKHCITVASGTDALLIAMMALGIGPGDEVITTPFTFIATGEMIALLGAKPVFVDIDPLTYNLDPNLIEAAITPRTRAIMPVSLYGQCADFDAINAIAEKHTNQRQTTNDQRPIYVIEDAAQSFGATYKGRRSCGLSTIGCTSFFPSKPLGCYGDGGACFTDDDTFAAAMRQIRAHGQDRRYHHPVIGLNGRMDTLQAAIVLAKFEIFPEEVELRASIGAKYTGMFEQYNNPRPTTSDQRRITTPYIAPHNTCVFAQYTILVENREVMQAKLKDEGIPTAVHYPVPLHRQPAFSHLGHAEGSFPVAEQTAQRVMSLPMHPYLDDEALNRITSAVAGTLPGR
jgi:UDP-2-acetamido-2-deoxy-ribo-hexuluronate aminotransferase